MTDLGSSRFPWYAVRTKHHHEKQVALALGHKAFDVFLPLGRTLRSHRARRQEIELPLFPGYVFCRFDFRNRLPILITPGVFFVLGIGRDPWPVPEEEIETIRRVMASGLQSSAHNYLQLGEQVRIVSGPLRDVTGLVEHLGASQLIVSITMLQRSVAVTINPEWVVPCKAGALDPIPYSQRLVGSGPIVGR